MATVILASRFNQLRDNVNKILGISSVSTPTYGYGQIINDVDVIGSRTSVANADKITAQQYRNLYIDLVRVRVHQVGISAISLEPFVIGNYDVNTINTDKVEESYINNLESLASSIDNDRFLIDVATQADVNTLINLVGNPVNSSRILSIQGPWNGTIEHIFDVNFIDSTSRRHFFNTGGQIRLSANVDYTGTQSKTITWKNAVSAMGTISLTANRSYSNASVGFGTNIGNYQLTSSYQLCYRQTAGGVYSNNFYEVRALSLDDKTVRIKVNFIDGQPLNTSTGIDEPVLGDFYSSVQLLTANGSANINGVNTNTVVYSDTVTGTLQSTL